jgi:hypothetical protein
MYPTINHDRADGALVIHGSHATLFGAVGTPVPADATMGVAVAAASAAIAGAVAIRSGATLRSPVAPPLRALCLAGAEGR